MTSQGRRGLGTYVNIYMYMYTRQESIISQRGRLAARWVVFGCCAPPPAAGCR